MSTAVPDQTNGAISRVTNGKILNTVSPRGKNSHAQTKHGGICNNTPITIHKHAPSRSRADCSAGAGSSVPPQDRSRARTTMNTVEGYNFFIEGFSGWKEEERKEMDVRLTRLGAKIAMFLDADVDFVVASSAGTSAPSTPTGGSTSKTRGISQRSHNLLAQAAVFNSKSAAGTGTMQTSPAQFAESHGKQLLNARKLEALLTAAEQRREQESARAKKRSRSGAPISCKTEAAENTNNTTCSLPKARRHTVRVRGIDTEFCKNGPGVPEWWHFPECDRHLYFAAEEPPEHAGDGKDTRTGHAGGEGPREDKKESEINKAGGKLERRHSQHVSTVKGGYCSLCKVKHENAKRHCDTKGHRLLALKLSQKPIP